MARDVKFLTDDIRKSLAKGGQTSSVLIMNSLSQNGPHWTGKFSSAWSAISGRSKKGKPARQNKGPKYQYSINDVKKTVIPKIASNRSSGYTLYKILNESPYAKVALDIDPWIPGQFDAPYGKVTDSRFIYGTRPPGGKRGQLDDIGSRNRLSLPNRSTASLDWYPTYVKGGTFAKDFKSGIRVGLKQGNANPGKA